MRSFYDLTSNSDSTLNNLLFLKPKRIGAILQEADLVSISQIERALESKEQYPHLRLGELLAMHGWVKSETADFFVQDWSNVLRHKERDPLGCYLQQAALLDQKEIEFILEEQRKTGIRFGTVAVLQGLIKSTTLDFFLSHLFPEELNVSPFLNMYGHCYPYQLDQDR
ncbi:MAG: hypothetical protein Tsb0014_18460 [Pleurocapsa sp.]